MSNGSFSGVPSLSNGSDPVFNDLSLTCRQDVLRDEEEHRPGMLINIPFTKERICERYKYLPPTPRPLTPSPKSLVTDYYSQPFP